VHWMAASVDVGSPLESGTGKSWLRFVGNSVRSRKGERARDREKESCTTLSDAAGGQGFTMGFGN